MKSKKDPEVYMDSDGILIIDGQHYIQSVDKKKKIDGIEHINKTLMKKFDLKGFEDKANYIAKRIMYCLSKKQLIKEMIERKGIIEVEKLYKVLKGAEKSRKKKITRQDGCVGIKVGTGKEKSGGFYFQLIEWTIN